MPVKTLIVIAGPTAVGKTDVSIRLAQYLNCPILSADSRQFYREMSIGTAKPSPTELDAAPHHFIDSLSIHDAYSVGDYERQALAELERVFAKKDAAILAGGSGLFIRAVCEGMDNFPAVSEEINRDLEHDLAEKGLPALAQELRAADPVYHAEADLHNARRVLRALAVIRSSGRTFTSFRRGAAPPRPFRCVYVILTREREVLYSRINRRTDMMMQAGLLEEVKELYPHRHLKSLQTVGYQEFFKYLDGEISLEEAVALVKRNSRRYAKRQMTWFKNQIPAGAAVGYFSPADYAEILDFIEQNIG